MGAEEIAMSTPRIFLCGITSAGNEANLRALIEPVSEHFNGLQWTFHLPADDGAAYLESQVGEGRIVYAHFAQRHGYSMTHYLWQGTMQPGDYCLQVDTLERISPQFCYEKLPGFIQLMEETGVAMIANYGKGLIFRFNEQLEFRGSPHWYATGLDGNAINVELEPRYFWNVRAEQRDPFQWVYHYAKYYLYPAGSNSALLGLEKQGDPQKLFPIVEQRRLEFREEMRKRHVPLTVEGLETLFRRGLDETLRRHVNQTKELNDYYRYVILGDKTVVDTHRLEDMKEIK
jgi:hypothetical protein